MPENKKPNTISIRLSDRMLEDLDAYAVLNEEDRTEVIRKAIAVYLSRSSSYDLLENQIKEITEKNKQLGLLIENLEIKVMCIATKNSI